MATLAVTLLYISGNYYLRDGFANKGYEEEDADDEDKYLPERPYSTEPIQKLDDYEYSVIFQNEGSRAAGKREISDAMSRYPLSWTARPPSDEKFQDFREAFVDASEKAAPPDTEKFKNISGSDMIPEDTRAIDEEEKKILAMYNPEKPLKLKDYSVKNVIRMVKKIYDKRGLIATVEKSKQANNENIFEVVEVRPKDEKIIWEDEVERDEGMERSAVRGEEQIIVPKMASDIAAGLDPYFEPRTKMRMDRNDYTKFTPGLERQFAPTYAHNSWF